MLAGWMGGGDGWGAGLEHRHVSPPRDGGWGHPPRLAAPRVEVRTADEPPPVSKYHRMMAVAVEKVRQQDQAQAKQAQRLGAIDPSLQRVNLLDHKEVGQYVRGVLDSVIAQPLSPRQDAAYHALRGPPPDPSEVFLQQRRRACRINPEGFAATLAVPWSAARGEGVPPPPPQGCARPPLQQRMEPSGRVLERASPRVPHEASPPRQAYAVPQVGGGTPSRAQVQAVLGTAPPASPPQPVRQYQSVAELGAMDDTLGEMRAEMAELRAERGDFVTSGLMSAAQARPTAQGRHVSPPRNSARASLAFTASPPLLAPCDGNRPDGGRPLAATLAQLRERVTGIVQGHRSRPPSPYA